MSIKDNFPTVRPQLLIDIANTEVLDPRVVSSRASVGTYYDKFGVLQTAGANVPRVGYNPSTGAVEGLIREAQGTNVLRYSEDFSNAAWAALSGALIVTPNTVIAPDGTLTADTLALANSYKAQSVSVSSGVVYSFSVYMQTDTGTKNIQLRDLAGGSGKTVTVTTSWQRFTFTYTPAGTLNYLGFDQRSGISPSQSGNIYIWGAQLEANDYATSYIKTEASQVTRAADSFLLTNTSDYDTDAFTAISQPFGVTSVSSGTVTLNSDVPIERLYVYPNNIAQDEINAVVENDGWWSWRIVGATFALPSFTTDGSIQVDWGDGTVETLTTAVHTFTNASPHTIRFRQMTGTYFRPFLSNNGTYAPLIKAVGSAPTNMQIQCQRVFWGATNLKSFDATLVGAGTDFTYAWQSCTSLTSFPLINTSAGTNFTNTWIQNTSLTEFPLIDTSAGTNFSNTWKSNTSLTSFPLLDTSSGTNFLDTWQSCTSLTSFPLLDTSSGTSFTGAWFNCTGLTEFPLLDTSSGTSFTAAWYNCTSLTSFPANFFDNWTGVPVANCFYQTWDNCTALTTTSVENILVSIDTSGTSAPATGTEITIDYNVATGALTSPTTSAITSLKGKNWTIKINGVLQ